MELNVNKGEHIWGTDSVPGKQTLIQFKLIWKVQF